MTPAQFIAKWSDSELRERQGSQEHFIDLCRLLGEPTPAEDDKTGDHYCFERGAEKVGGGDGWADVWRKGCFGWEYKGRHKDLNAALRQLQAYALDLENPPYLVVSDMERIIVHTNWTNTVSAKFTFTFDDLRDPRRLEQLRLVFQGSDRLKPTVNPQDITAKAAATFGELGRRLQERGHHPRAVAHFLNRLVFCMFAEDARLLPQDLFTRIIKATNRNPAAAQRQLAELFAKMGQPDAASRFFGADLISWFNGGLFDDAGVLPLEEADLRLILDTASEHDWSEIDPAIFGTLFEQALKATRERPALGAHFTDREKILKIVDPVIVRPLSAEWDAARAEIAAEMAKADAAEAERKRIDLEGTELLKMSTEEFKRTNPARNKARAAALRARTVAATAARARLEAFLVRLAAFRVLDPACGSGNFLYVALHALKDLELRAIVDADRLGVPEVPLPRVGLDAVRGIEIEEYAAELARVTLWIGDLQWMRKNGYTNWQEPILSSLDQIECRDALLTRVDDAAGGEGAWVEAEWPVADVIIGNPPFLGGKRLRSGLGDGYVERLFRVYTGRVPAEADFVCYWVEKASRAIGPARAERAGLVTTNSIRGGANRRVLDPIADANAIHEAWADEPWVLDGAAVRVSMVGFGNGFVGTRLAGQDSARVNADLTSFGPPLSTALALPENLGCSYQGPVLIGPFQVSGPAARDWLVAPLNPNKRPNSDVLRPIANASALVRSPADQWVVDFGKCAEAEASLFEAPFEYALVNIRPVRIRNRRSWRAEQWWRHGEAGGGWRDASFGLRRYIATPRVAKHRLFVWLPREFFPDSATVAIARDDDTTFGILHSRFHELWSLRLGTWLGVGNDPRYTPSTTFETFPFPEGLTPNIPAADYADDPRAIAIADAAKDLNRLREAWLNPADLVTIVPEVVPTAAPGEAPVKYPDRILPKDEAAEKELKKRTLTKLYNDRPAWLDMAHKRLDAAVAAAYGWPANLSDEEILARLFALNQERAAAGR